MGMKDALADMVGACDGRGQISPERRLPALKSFQPKGRLMPKY